MNSIEVKRVKTCYLYEEDYWIIDDKPITLYLEQEKPSSCSKFGSLLGLLPAWSGKLLWQWENDFVWELIDREIECNVPILVCEDDCDLSCIVVVVHIHKTKEMVYWDRIGILNKSNMSTREYEQSGILCLEAYTEEDWKRYGDNIATETYGSLEYWNWVRKHCYEEHIRRLRNYWKPYMQKEEHIEWAWKVDWRFLTKDYERMVNKYRKLKGVNMKCKKI